MQTDLLLPFELHLGEAEAYVCNLLNREKISSNTVIASNLSSETNDRKYMIFSFISGAPLSQKHIKRRSKSNLYQQIGELTKKIHNISGTYFGRVSDSFRNITHSTWTDYIFSELNELNFSCEKHQVFSPEYFGKIQSLFKIGKHYFDIITIPRLVHGDLWAGNIMIDFDKTHVAAIIDTDRSLFGDPDMDLASAWLINRDFLKGYGDIEKDDSRNNKMLYYQLLYAITSAYVWKVEYNNNGNYKKSCKTVKCLVKKLERKSTN